MSEDPKVFQLLGELKEGLAGVRREADNATKQTAQELAEIRSILQSQAENGLGVAVRLQNLENKVEDLSRQVKDDLLPASKKLKTTVLWITGMSSGAAVTLATLSLFIDDLWIRIGKLIFKVG